MATVTLEVLCEMAGLGTYFGVKQYNLHSAMWASVGVSSPEGPRWQRGAQRVRLLTMLSVARWPVVRRAVVHRGRCVAWRAAALFERRGRVSGIAR